MADKFNDTAKALLQVYAKTDSNEIAIDVHRAIDQLEKYGWVYQPLGYVDATQPMHCDICHSHSAKGQSGLCSAHRHGCPACYDSLKEAVK